MKKLLLILTMLVMMLPSMCFADPVIKSDSRTFNPLTGVYDLQGNVFVQFPAHDTTLTITGDATKVYLYAMEVHGQGNIRLSFSDMSFACDKVDVYHSGRTAYVKEVVTEELTEPVAVYNFEVADFHTYYVGENSVLVHNMQCSLFGRGSGYRQLPTEGRAWPIDEEIEQTDAAEADNKSKIVNAVMALPENMPPKPI